MPILKTPPAGYTATPWTVLKMSRQNFYQSGLNTLWDDGPLTAYRVASNTPTFYSKDEVGKVAHWLYTRQGLIALGKIPGNTALLPKFDILAWFEEGEYDDQCPHCGGAAIGDDNGLWCGHCAKKT